MGRDSSLTVGNWSWWSWIQVLIWVKSSESSKIGETGDLEQVGLVEGLLVEATLVVVVAVLVIVVVLLLVVVVFIMISWWLNWESDTFWNVWKRINQFSLLFWLMVERALITEFAFFT